MTQLLSADAGGTRGRKNLPSAFHAIRPLEHVKVTNRMWRLLLDADLPHKANDKSDLVPRRKANGKSRSDLYRELSLDAMSDNARAIAVLKEKMGAASRQDYLQLERLLSVYEDTFTYMLTLKEQFVSFGGPHQILLKKYHDTGSKFKKRMDKPGLPGVLEKYAMPAVGALITGGALVKTGVLTWLADRLVLVGIDPLLVEGTLGVGAMGLVAAGIKVAMGSLMGVASRKRHNVLELRAEEALMEIGFQLNEIKKAMVNLAGMEYLRLAAKNELPISPVQESSYIIAQKMACLAVEMREKYGFNLALPIEVENDMLGLLHPVHVSKPRLIAQCIHSHLEAIFRRQHDGHYTAMYSNGLHAA